MRRRWPVWRTIALLLVLLANIACFVSVALDRAAIRVIAYKIIKPGAPSREVLQACMDYVHGTLADNSIATVEAMPFWTRLNYQWNPRRVGPGTTLSHGTHQIAPCQTHSRALMALLEAHGLRSRVIALHSSDLRGAHGILEVDLGEDGTAIVDPQHGIFYRRSDGQFANLTELRTDPGLARRNQENAFKVFNEQGKAPVKSYYPVGVDGYTFDFPAYCNYRDFGPLRWKVRDLLHSWYGESGYLIPKWPNWYVLWPAYNLAFAIDVIAGGVVVVMFIAGWRTRRRLRAASANLALRTAGLGHGQ